jgi:flagellar biosynthesis chaperone FliJ
MPKLIKVKIVVNEDGGYYIEEDRDDGFTGQEISHPADVIAVLENILAKHEATLSKEVIK